MSQLFSTDLIPPADRLDAWLWNARQICGDCRFQVHKHSPFHGSIERRKVGGFELTLFSSTALSFNKFPSVNVQFADRAFIIITQLAGVRQYRQDGKTAVLSKGDTTIIDSGLPWTSNCSGDCARLYLRVPFSVLERKVHGVTIPNATRISGTRGLGATLFQLMRVLYQQAGNLNEEEGAAALEAYLRMFLVCIGAPSGTRGKTEATATSFRQILSYINRHLTETTLCPTEIASVAGISVRHLHRLFAGKGSTVNEWIRVQRLKHCWEELARPDTRGKSITEIALYWGFNDSAHFSHSFKKQFGVAPRLVRRQPQSGVALDDARAYAHLKLRQISLS